MTFTGIQEMLLYLQKLMLYRHCSAEQIIVPARGKALVDTQISIAVPEGTYGRIAPRSGLGTLLAMLITPKTV